MAKERRFEAVAFCALLATCFFSEVRSSDVSWLLHISDLHLSVYASSRASDLEALIQQTLPRFNVSTALVTGDLVDAKTRFKRSQQRLPEWEQYDSIIHASHLTLDTSESSFLDVPGNHDSFDSGPKGGDRDYYRLFGVQGDNFSKNRVLIHPFGGTGTCPMYCLVGVDLTPAIGLRSPTNFFGIVTGEILDELESTLAADTRRWYGQGCDPVYLSYGHYPLSMIGTEGGVFAHQGGLKRALLKYGVSAWLCGHLHDEFGNHLFRIHYGDASRLLELEMTDWKFERRFRILALDRGHLSALDLVMEEKSEPAIIRPLSPDVQIQDVAILMTSPPTPYFSPLNRVADPVLTAPVRALIWPMKDSLQMETLTVEAAVYCGDRAKPHMYPMHDDNASALYASDVSMAFMMGICSEGAQEAQVQVRARAEGSALFSWSDLRKLEDREQPDDYPHSFLEKLILTVPWCAFFQNLFVSMMLFHIFILILLPKALSYLKAFQPRPHTLDEIPNGQSTRWKTLLLGPVQAFVSASRFRVFWWGQLCFSMMLLFGPWSFARVLSGEPLGILFLTKVYIQLHSKSGFDAIYSPEMPFRAVFFYLSCILPFTIWMVWSFHRMMSKANGSSKRHKITLFFYILLLLFCLGSFARSAVFSVAYYGPGSLFLSPIYVGYVALNGWAFYAAVRSIPKCRRE